VPDGAGHFLLEVGLILLLAGELGYFQLFVTYIVETCDEKACPGYCLCYKNMLYVLYLFSKSSETFVSIFQRMIYRIMH